MSPTFRTSLLVAALLVPVAGASETPPAGAPAAAGFLEFDSKGEVVAVDALKAPGKITVLFFTSPHCRPCDMLAPPLKHLAGLDDAVKVRHLKVDRPGATGIDYESAISKHYGIKVLPHAIIYDEKGEEVARGDEAVGRLMEQFGELPPPATGAGPVAKEGLPAQGVHEITQGNPVRIEDYLVEGKHTVVDFFSPFCGPCVQIAPILEKLVKERPDVVVRTVNINRPGAWGIDWMSPVARQYQIRGVPYMQLYGPDGKLKSKGQQAIMEVLGMAGVE